MTPSDRSNSQPPSLTNFVSRSQLRKLSMQYPVEAALLLAEAQEVIDGMAEWMRSVLPSQVEPGTSPEREALLLAARKWKVALDDY